MAKRFTDTNKYKKPFIRGLQGAYKVLWDYVYHDCDHAGIWIVDFEIAQIYVGKDLPVNNQDALKYFNNGQIRVIEICESTKWFLPDFIEFQYGKLNEDNRAHKSVIDILSKYSLLSNKGLVRSLQGRKDKDKDKDSKKDIRREELLNGIGDGLIKIDQYLLQFPELEKDAIEVIEFMRKTKNPKSKLPPDKNEIEKLIQNWLFGGVSKEDLMKMITGAGYKDFEKKNLTVKYILNTEHRAKLLMMEEEGPIIGDQKSTSNGDDKARKLADKTRDEYL